MSDLSTAPADQAAADLAAADTEQTDPVWEKAFDDAGIPDLLRPKLRETARSTTANANKAIETARGGGVPAEWQAFVGGASQAGVNPNDLIDAWNAAQAIRQDPVAFARDLNAEIAKRVGSGEITPAQGQQAREEGAQAIAAASDPNAPLSLKTAEQEQLEELRAWRDQQEQRQTNEEQERENQQILREADANAQAFGQELLGQLTNAGYTQAAGTLNDDVIGSVGRIAASALDADQTGTLTHQQAIATALATLERISGGARPVPQATVPGALPQQMPVGGGRGAPAMEQKPVFAHDNNGQRAERKWREEQMLEAGRRIMNGEISVE